MSPTTDGPAQVVLAVPVFGRLELTRACLSALDALTPTDVPLLVIDDVGPERLTTEDVAAVVTSGRSVELVLHERNVGFVGSANDAFERAAPADVVLVNSDVTVLPGWFEELRAAAGGGGVASASAIADNGGILSVPALARVGALRSDDRAAVLATCREAVPAAVDIPVAVAHCTWFRRDALQAIGAFDLAFAPGYGEEVDWSLRARRAGRHHVAAMRSYVLHAESASFGRATSWWSLQRRHEALLLRRYPLRWLGLRRFARDAGSGLALGRDLLASTIEANTRQSGAP
jgi:GT2 family glycosyltransferase